MGDGEDGDPLLTDPLLGDVSFEDPPEKRNGDGTGAEPQPDEAGAVFEEPKEPKEPVERRPIPLFGRTSAADLLAFVWTGIGTGLIQSGADIPVGRVMQFQAPFAGSQLDKLIAGTWIDNLIQPLVRQAGKAEGMGAVIAMPLLVAAYERNPLLEPVVAPILRQVVEYTLVDMAPVLQEKSKKTRRAAKAVSDLSEVFELQAGEDPVDAVLASIFAPMPDMQPPPEPE